jgi:hypothetical protein
MAVSNGLLPVGIDMDKLNDFTFYSMFSTVVVGSSFYLIKLKMSKTADPVPIGSTVIVAVASSVLVLHLIRTFFW